MRILLTNLTKMVGDTGGLAKVACAFANEMYKRGHDVSLVYSDVRKGDFYYPLDKKVTTYDLCHYGDGEISFPLHLKVKREILRAFSKAKARAVNDEFIKVYLLPNLQEILEWTQPECIISFQPAASKALLCDIGTKVPVITMSHGDPEDYFYTYPPEEIPALVKSAVNQVLLPSFSKHITDRLPEARTVVIGNAIPQFSEQAALDMHKERYTIVFVGMLTKNHKRPHLLVESFAKLATTYPDWHVELWGAEDRKTYKAELELLIKRNNLENRVHFMGTTEQVPEVLQKCDIFAFPSACEGFGLALAEAMSMGLPAVGYRNCPAVNELIEDGKNGILCEDGVLPFAGALETLMKDQNLRIAMGNAGKEAMKQYAPEKIWDSWEQVIKEVSRLS